jgi:glycogen synthase
VRILVQSPVWRPSVGGIESLGETLVREFARAGHHVTVLTLTPGATPSEGVAYTLIRRPGVRDIISEACRADVVLQHGPSLRLGWPLLALPKALVVSVHMPFMDEGGLGALKRRLKRAWLHRADTLVFPSQYMRHRWGGEGLVIPNCFDAERFFLGDRDRGSGGPRIACVARLIRAKGVHLLIEAATLRQRELRQCGATIRVVGDGPERAELTVLAGKLGVSDLIDFEGALPPEAVGILLRSSDILVVPSLWEEPFGIAALEGVVSGCVVVAARTGGLPEAAGPGAVLYDRDSPHALSNALMSAVRAPGPDRRLVEQHRERHTPQVVAAHYLEVLADLMPRR